MKQIFSLLLFCCSCSGFAQGAFLTRPTKVFFNTDPAQVQKQSVEIRNTGDGPVLLDLSLQDWSRDSVGNKLYVKPGSLANSCGHLLKLSETKIALQPGEVKFVEITLQAPPDSLKHALNTMLMVTQANEKSAEKTKAVSAQFNMVMRIGVHIYFQPAYLTERKVELQRLFFAKSGSESKENLLANANGIVSEFTNTGKTIEEGKIRLELSNTKTGEVFTINERPFNSLPGDRLQIPFTLPANLPKGNYSVTAMLDIGTDAALNVLESEIEL